MSYRSLVVALAAALIGTHGVTHAAGIETRQLSFARGASSATVQGTLVGDQTVDYKLRARAGQQMNVLLEASNGSTYFNVLPPGSNDVAVFVGSNGGNQWSGTLEADSEYTVRVYLMRNAARRDEKSRYTLKVAIEGAAVANTAAGGLPGAIERASQGKFDARGQIPCAQNRGQPMGQCPFTVTRAGGGTAVVNVTRPDGRKRAIFFEKGRPTGADLSQADGNMDFRATRQADLNYIQAGDERYEIPDAAVTGG
jgi:hypothetical protein